MWWVMLAGGTAIFLLVMALLALAMRGRAGTGSERVWLWGLGIGFPGVTLAALTVWGLIAGAPLLPRTGPEVVTVSAQARQWAWTFGYADAPGRTTEGVLHIPAGRPVDVEITSIDVIHAFWVPRLAGKLDAIPGRMRRLRIEADAPGTYQGQSAEFSGTGYREHLFTVTAHDAAGWQAFLQEGVP